MYASLAWQLLYLGTSVFSCSSDNSSEVELLGHMVVQFLVILRNLYVVVYNTCTNLQSHQHCTRVPFPPHSHCHLLLFDDSHSDMCQLVSYCGSDLHFPSNLEHIFMYLLATCCHFQSRTFFFNKIMEGDFLMQRRKRILCSPTLVMGSPEEHPRRQR